MSTAKAPHVTYRPPNSAENVVCVLNPDSKSLTRLGGKGEVYAGVMEFVQAVTVEFASSSHGAAGAASTTTTKEQTTEEAQEQPGLALTPPPNAAPPPPPVVQQKRTTTTTAPPPSVEFDPFADLDNSGAPTTLEDGDA